MYEVNKIVNEMNKVVDKVSKACDMFGNEESFGRYESQSSRQMA